MPVPLLDVIRSDVARCCFGMVVVSVMKVSVGCGCIIMVVMRVRLYRRSKQFSVSMGALATGVVMVERSKLRPCKEMQHGGDDDEV